MRLSGPNVRGTDLPCRYFAGMSRRGNLMLVDAVLTVTWQEPVSAYFAQQSQDKLNKELKADKPLEEADKRTVASIRNESLRLKRLAGLARARARTGHAIGTIR